MSEPAAEQVDGQKAEAPVENEQHQTVEEVAAEQGHKSKEDWVANGGDPKEWRSAEVFIERGVWIQKHKAQEKRLDEMESTFNTRMDNANKLHAQQMEAQKSDLVRKRDEAIDLADREKANGYQNDIDKLNEQTIDTSPASNDQGTLDAWNTANSWIMGSDPKAAYAKQQFGVYQQQGMTAGQALATMEADVNRAFPALNPERENQPIPEGGSRPGKKRAARKLAMSDLTSEEMKYYRAMPGAWKSEADYLQAVQDTRGES